MDLKNSCLLVIDMQKDFLDELGYYVNMGADISPMKKVKENIEKILDKVKIPVIYVMAEYEFGKFGDGKSICVHGTFGSESVLDKKYSDKVFIKHEHDAFSNLEFREFLKEQKIKNILVTGITTENCIRATVLSGLQKGFSMSVIEDCVSTNKSRYKLHIDALKEIEKKGGILISSCDLI